MNIRTYTTSFAAVALTAMLLQSRVAYAINYDDAQNLAFETIDEIDGTYDLGLRFGGSLQEFIIYHRNEQRFSFSDDVWVQGNISGASLTIMGTASISGSLILEGGSALSGATIDANNNRITNITGALIWYVDDVLTAGPEQSVAFVLPIAFTPKDVEMKAVVGPTGSAVIVDINENGTSIFSTRPEIDDGAEVEDGNQVISDTSLAKGSTITLDIDQIGSTQAGSGLTIQLVGTYDL